MTAFRTSEKTTVWLALVEGSRSFFLSFGNKSVELSLLNHDVQRLVETVLILVRSQFTIIRVFV